MASNPPAACCASGFKHEGAATGELKNIDGGKILNSPNYSHTQNAPQNPLLTKLFSSQHLYRLP